MYETATKNKEKPEFDFGNNRNCLDYYIEQGEQSFISGSMTPIGNEDYQECYTDFSNLPYSKEEFNKESRKLINRFLNLKNKKEYNEGLVYETHIRLWNEDLEEYESLHWVLKLTYCP